MAATSAAGTTGAGGGGDPAGITTGVSARVCRGHRPAGGPLLAVAAPAEQLAEPADQAGAPAGAARPARLGRVRLLGLGVPAHQERVDPLIYLPLDEPAAPGGSLKLIGHPQVLGAPAPERVHGLDPHP
jgi:hypothetical protein